jgi:S1-C subfamily serine protease
MEALKSVNLTVVLCVALLCGTGVYLAPQLRPVAPVPVVPIVPGYDFAEVRAIAAANPAKAKLVGKAFADFAFVHERDTASLTTGGLREQIARFEGLVGPFTLERGAMPGFSAAATNGLVSALGKDDVPLDKAKSVPALKALAAACGVN